MVSPVAAWRHEIWPCKTNGLQDQVFARSMPVWFPEATLFCCVLRTFACPGGRQILSANKIQGQCIEDARNLSKTFQKLNPQGAHTRPASFAGLAFACPACRLQADGPFVDCVSVHAAPDVAGPCRHSDNSQGQVPVKALHGLLRHGLCHRSLMETIAARSYRPVQWNYEDTPKPASQFVCLT